MKDALGDRMKSYENVSRHYLTDNLPVIVRVDGKSFHMLTRRMEKPFDMKFIKAMQETAFYMCKEIQNVKAAYVQSDEISLVLYNGENINTQTWFGNNLQKIASVSASMATMRFNELMDTRAMFDSRAFILPNDEVMNYFLWRQKDWLRNSVMMKARNHFSHKQLQSKNRKYMLDMLYINGTPWEELPDVCKNGTFINSEPFDYVVYEDIRLKWCPFPFTAEDLNSMTT